MGLFAQWSYQVLLRDTGIPDRHDSARLFIRPWEDRWLDSERCIALSLAKEIHVDHRIKLELH